MIPKKASTPNSDSIQHTPPFRPSIVFSRDDAAGSGKEPDASPRVLIVEDDFLVASDMEAALIEAGVEVSGVAGSVEEALQLAQAERPTMAVMISGSPGTKTELMRH